MLDNEHIKLRAPEPEDLDFLYTIENDPELWTYSNRREPYSRFAVKQYLSNCDQSVFERGQLRFVVEHKNSGKPIGTIDIFDYDHCNRKAEIGIFIDNPHRRQGYALQAIAMITEYARQYLHLHQLYGYVDVDNTASLRTLTKAGFCHTATLSDWLWKGSRFTDVVLLQQML